MTAFVCGLVGEPARKNRVNCWEPQRVMPVVISSQAQGSAFYTWEGSQTRLVTSARNKPIHERPTPYPAQPAGGDIVASPGEIQGVGINSLLQGNVTRPRLIRLKSLNVRVPWQRKRQWKNAVNCWKPQRVMPVVISSQAQGKAKCTWEGSETRRVRSHTNKLAHERRATLCFRVDDIVRSPSESPGCF